MFKACVFLKDRVQPRRSLLWLSFSSPKPIFNSLEKQMNLLGIYFNSLPQVQVKCWRSDLTGTRNSCHFSLLAKDLTDPSFTLLVPNDTWAGGYRAPQQSYRGSMRYFKSSEETEIPVRYLTFYFQYRGIICFK